PAFFVFLLAFLLDSPSKATIRYEVSVDHPEQHLFHVTMTIPAVTGEVIIQMAAWNALYQIRDFGNHVRQGEGFSGSGAAPASIEKMDKQTWRISGNGTIVVRYSTYWDEAGPFASQLTAEHAFINPAMILFYVPSRRDESVSVSIGFASAAWRAAGPLLRHESEFVKHQRPTFDAPSFDALADGPIEIGKFEEFEL